MSQREDRHRRSSGRQRVGVLQGSLIESSTPPVGAAGGRRYRLRPSIEPLAVGDRLYLIRSGSEDLEIRDADDVDRALLKLLSQAELTAGELASCLALDAGAVDLKLEALDRADALAPDARSAPLGPDDAERFSRQLPYLAEYGDERDLQRRLMAARIVVLGCGGLGTWALAALASAGVRHFRLVDDDTIDLSNLNRQAIYRSDQIGRAKTEVAADWLRGFDPNIEVETVPLRVDGIPAALRVTEDADLLVLVADEPPYQLGRWVGAASLELGVPFIAAGQVPPMIRIGPLYLPGQTACFACHETALRALSMAYDAYVQHAQSSPIRSATLGPASAIVGAMLAMEVVHLLIGVEPATAGHAVTVDIRTWDVDRHPVPCDPRCDACRSP